MKFSDFDNVTQEKMIELLNDHIAVTADILKQDRCLIPMLMIPNTNQLVSLQSRDGAVDIDKAHALVIEKLKNETFEYALFSYSTRIGLATGGESDALKTYIFTSNGIEVSFCTPFAIKGLLKKTVNVEKTIFLGIKENIFD